MEENSNSIEYMKKYLKYAIEFEKYVYIWTNSMNTANNQMRAIYKRRSQLESAKKSAQGSLQSLDSKYQRQQENNEQEYARCKRNAKIAFRVFLVDIILCIIVGCIMIVSFLEDGDSSDYQTTLMIIGFAAVTTIILFFVTLIGPISYGIYASNKKDYIKYQAEIEGNTAENSRRRNEIVLTDKIQEAENEWAVTVVEESLLSEQQEEISNALQTAKQNLASLYSEGILPQRYRCLNAVATLYEYLDTGRCTIIQGHGGIFDTYENDLKLGLIIKNLSEINSHLASIRINQQLLYQEIQQANSSLSSIKSSLLNIEKTNQESAKNTAISAVADQQTATSTHYLAWRKWADGQ